MTEAREALKELQRHGKKTAANPGRVEELGAEIEGVLDRLDELEETDRANTELIGVFNVLELELEKDLAIERAKVEELETILCPGRGNPKGDDNCNACEFLEDGSCTTSYLLLKKELKQQRYNAQAAKDANKAVNKNLWDTLKLTQNDLATERAKVDFLLSKTECHVCPKIMDCDGRKVSPERIARGSDKCIQVQRDWLTTETGGADET